MFVFGFIGSSIATLWSDRRIVYIVAPPRKACLLWLQCNVYFDFYVSHHQPIVRNNARDQRLRKLIHRLPVRSPGLVSCLSRGPCHGPFRGCHDFSHCPCQGHLFSCQCLTQTEPNRDYVILLGPEHPGRTQQAPKPVSPLLLSLSAPRLTQHFSFAHSGRRVSKMGRTDAFVCPVFFFPLFTSSQMWPK